MRRVTLRSGSGGVAWVCEVADRPWTRVRGLLGRSGLAAGTGLWIVPCHSIHMWFMRFAIDAVFLARDGRVVALRPGLQPGQVVWPVRGAHSVVELPAGTLADAGLAVGDRLAVDVQS